MRTCRICGEQISDDEVHMIYAFVGPSTADAAAMELCEKHTDAFKKMIERRMMALTYTLAQDERMSDTDARALIKDVLGLDMSQTNFKAYLNRARRCTTMEVEG